MNKRLKTAVMKIEPPRLDCQRQLVMDGLILEDEAEFSCMKLAGSVFQQAVANFLIIDKCEFHRGCFIGSSLSQLRVADSRFDGCDLSNANWSKCKANRNQFVNAKLTGFISVKSYFSNVSFESCIAGSAQFLESEFKKVCFNNCKLTDADFQSCDLQEARFTNCDLTGANFDEAKLAGADFRGSDLKAVKVRPQDLKGAIISREQAEELGPYFATLLGLKVLEN